MFGVDREDPARLSHGHEKVPADDQGLLVCGRPNRAVAKGLRARPDSSFANNGNEYAIDVRKAGKTCDGILAKTKVAPFGKLLENRIVLAGLVGNGYMRHAKFPSNFYKSLAGRVHRDGSKFHLVRVHATDIKRLGANRPRAAQEGQTSRATPFKA